MSLSRPRTPICAALAALAGLVPLLATGCYTLVPFDGLSRGSTAPLLEVYDWVGGSSAELSDDGGPTLVEFWSKECPPCVRKIETMRALATRFAGKLRVVTIHVDLPGKAPATLGALEEFVSAHRIPYPVGLDTRPDRFREWSFRALPHAVLLDGREVVWSGNLLVWDVETGLARLGLTSEGVGDRAPLPAENSGAADRTDTICAGGVCRLDGEISPAGKEGGR